MGKPEDHGMDAALLARFIAGECTEDERDRILEWMRDDRARAGLVSALEAVWRVTDSDSAAWDVDRAWDEVAARRSADPGRGVARSSSGRVALFSSEVGARRGGAMWAFRSAAALVLLLGAALLWNQLGRPVPGADPLQTREITTGPAERTHIDLADGTRVALAPESRLRIAGGYGGDAREVEFEGQAVFDVARDPARPFRVRTRGVVTEVIGTRFAVRAYAGESDVSVALAEGAVRLRAAGAGDDSGELTLRPGQVARAEAGGAARLDDGATVDALLAWTDGRLVFEDTPLREVAAEIGRWYDVDVRLADDGLGERRLTASFGDEPVSQVLDLIALSLDLRYDRDGREIFLAPR